MLEPAVVHEKLPDITDFVGNLSRHRPDQGHRSRSSRRRTTRWAASPTDVDGRVVVDDQNTPLPGPLRRRRVRLRLGPRRQPSGHQLAGGHHRLRPPCRPAHAALPQGGANGSRCRPTPTDRRARRSSACWPRRATRRWRRYAPKCSRCMDDNAGVVRDAEKLKPGPGQAGRAARALRQRRHPGQGAGLQHRPDRGLGAGQPARHRRGDRAGGAGARGEPRRALSRGLPQARRRPLAEAHAGHAPGRADCRSTSSRSSSPASSPKSATTRSD